VPDTGMIVTLDLSNATDIHGTDKHAVGERLASWALASQYGKTNVPASGPLYRGMQIRPWGVEVTFDHTDGGLVASARPLGGFEVAGADRVFRPALAVIYGETVIVRSPQVPQPVAVRYAWSNAPAASLKSRAGLPASPFRTDDWPGVTDDAFLHKWVGG